MEHRRLGRSGLMVPALSFGAGTFGGRGPLFGAWGTTDVAQAREIVDICLEAGITMFDTADVYSDGASEEVLGAALEGRRDEVLISTKAGLPIGDGPWRRRHLPLAADRRQSTPRCAACAPTASTSSSCTPTTRARRPRRSSRRWTTLVDAGKIRYVGVSNYSGWQLMQSLGVADRNGWPRYVAHQVYYSLVGRDYEWDLMPLGAAEGVGALVWSPLGWGRLTGRIRRGQRRCRRDSRLHQTAGFGPPVDDELLFDVVDVLDELALETGRTVPQIALNWLLTRPTVASVIIGARDAAQLAAEPRARSAGG